MKKHSTVPASSSTTIRPPVSAAPSTVELCLLRKFTRLSEIFSRFPVLTCSGDEASQDWSCVLVCSTWVTSAGYSASTRAVTSHTAPPLPQPPRPADQHEGKQQGAPGRAERPEPGPPQAGGQRLQQRAQQDRG